MSRALALCLGLALLAACAPTQTTAGRRYTLIVQNQCKGSNEAVYLYVNGQYWGVVQGSRAIQDLAPGNYSLRAVGTQPGGLPLTRQLQLDRDQVWTLCP
ncbi:hypothetical protein [Meiothermus granaticius]|uniref:Uncharacterized protein n=1 Tax=Meiothermus granaticius NBRC 107808 TaxID=1227551 RepID=A0A399FC60_9DEIN|nr:hypothetical protein [Meiothermus granaticius]MCL6526488.1 hypothetical protein [Thermaceae bacterium]RIH92889.1 hypothetical protein Mgrana_01164 [Meiothermus granaticius NBRC 107808]GEM86745.1 hypothetical protein MGR01S_13700 [Meiothermus granaticius NBRC 107808]